MYNSNARYPLGSALHALAQPTPTGDGPLGFMTVLNDAIVITEKLLRGNTRSCGLEY